MCLTMQGKRLAISPTTYNDTRESNIMNVCEYDDQYPTCERTHVELRIYSDTLTCREISSRLDVEPSRQREKGTIRQSVTGSQTIAERSTWILSTELLVDSHDLRRHLDHLLTLLADSCDAILKLQFDDGVYATIWGIWWSAHGHGGPTLAWDEMKRLAELHLDLCLDVYFVEETME